MLAILLERCSVFCLFRGCSVLAILLERCSVFCLFRDVMCWLFCWRGALCSVCLGMLCAGYSAGEVHYTCSVCLGMLCAGVVTG